MKPIHFRVLRIGIVSFLLGGSIACTDLFNFFGPKNIAQIKEIEVKEGENLDRKVSVKGIVGERIAFLDSGAYQLTDETGTIWVFTKNFLPQEGAGLEIKGQLRRKSIPIADRDLGEFYIFETERNKIPESGTAGFVPVSQPN